MDKNKVEILAPVGSPDMVSAGLAAGADSFYMALDDFGARAYAENFNLENIGDYIDYIHLFGKKVFVTVNTLIKDEELEKALHYISILYQKGVDAILIQDIGLFHLIKDRVPGMEIHASTQMAVRDFYGAKALEDLGFDRVVIARETPFSEIEKIVTLNIDTEVFVHGSLCVSFSGECLMSSYLGKRSANRGRCAGNCRKPYKLISDGKVLKEDYFLSMNDLNTIDYIEKLVDIGVDSLKIEGRMKSPEYAYTIAKNYKDMASRGEYSKKDLLDISNRPYTKGFIFGQKRSYTNLKGSLQRRSLGQVKNEGRDKYFITNSPLKKGSILEVTTNTGKKLPFTQTRDHERNEKIYLKAYPDAKLESQVRMINSTKIEEDLKSALDSYKSLPVDIEFFAHVGDLPKLILTYKDKKVSYEGEKSLERAKKISIKEADIKENLARFNDEVFEPQKITVHMDSDVFIRKKDINKARRQGVALLEEAIKSPYHRKDPRLSLKEKSESSFKKREHNIELLTNDVDPKRLKAYDNIYIRAYDPKFDGLNLYYVLDSHMDYDIDRLIEFLKENNIKGVVFNNYRDLAFLDDFKKNKIKVRIGRYLNIFNSYAFEFYKDKAEMITGSVELSFDHINDFSKNYPVEAVTFGKIELMTMVHCPFSAIKNCGHKGCKTCSFNEGKLEDDEGHVFDVKRYDGYSKIYANSLAHVDPKRFSDRVSFLSLISSNEDLDKLENNRKIDNLNYERGVL